MDEVSALSGDLSRKKQAVRSAEASRVSSCSFADLVAQLAISHYHTFCPESLRAAYQQTVLAAILLQDGDAEPTVVAAGVGTKTLPQALLLDDIDRRRVHDCHAEVLARRAFLRYLYHQLTLYHAQQPSIFVSSTSSLRLRDSISLHLYTSSQPCGNACIKRWGKASTPTFDSSPSYQAPRHPHPTYYPTAIAQGEVALLCKRNHSSQVDQNTSQCPPGTCIPGSSEGLLMTCSDKIAKWNALGLQGGALSHFLEPIYLSSITIGRKCSIRHAQRALCCRLQKFSCGPYGTHHPNIYCTAVKFDESAISTDTTKGAQFTEPRCVYWCADNICEAGYRVINSSTGWENTEQSFLCGDSLKRLFQTLHDISAYTNNCSNEENDWMYNKALFLDLPASNVSSQMRQYYEAKQKLLSEKSYFSEWVRSYKT